MGFNCLEGVQHGISKHERRMLETAFPDNDPAFILESAFMFTKHFCNFLIWFWTQSRIGVKGFIFINRSSNVLERKKKMLEVNKRERGRPFYITSLPLTCTCRPGVPMSPEPGSFCLQAPPTWLSCWGSSLTLEKTVFYCLWRCFTDLSYCPQGLVWNQLMGESNSTDAAAEKGERGGGGCIPGLGGGRL